MLASPVAYTMPDVMSSSELLMESIERQGQELLDRVAAQAERAGVSYTTLLKWGNVPETICKQPAKRIARPSPWGHGWSPLKRLSWDVR